MKSVKTSFDLLIIFGVGGLLLWAAVMSIGGLIAAFHDTPGLSVSVSNDINKNIADIQPWFALPILFYVFVSFVRAWLRGRNCKDES